MFALITGGSGSGKSEYAEKLTCTMEGRRYYLATMAGADEESRQRIERHRRMRADRQFTTIEQETDIGDIMVPPDSCVLLEDMGNLLANTMYGVPGDLTGEPADTIIEDVNKLRKKCKNLIIVTNETGSGGILYDEGTVEYMKKLAYINRELAKEADFVGEIICGMACVLKEPV